MTHRKRRVSDEHWRRSFEQLERELAWPEPGRPANAARAHAWAESGEYVLRGNCEYCGGRELIRKDERAIIYQHYAMCPKAPRPSVYM